LLELVSDVCCGGCGEASAPELLGGGDSDVSVLAGPGDAGRPGDEPAVDDGSDDDAVAESTRGFVEAALKICVGQRCKSPG